MISNPNPLWFQALKVIRKWRNFFELENKGWMMTTLNTIKSIESDGWTQSSPVLCVLVGLCTFHPPIFVYFQTIREPYLTLINRPSLSVCRWLATDTLLISDARQDEVDVPLKNLSCLTGPISKKNKCTRKVRRLITAANNVVVWSVDPLNN